MCFLAKILFGTKFKANSMCLYFSPKSLFKKKSMKICSSLTWRHDEKCKICVTIRKLLKWIYHHSCLWGTVIQECSLKIRSSHRDVFINNAVLNLWLNSLNYLWWSSVFSKCLCDTFLLLTTGAEELCFITSFCWTTNFVEHLLKATSVFWKAGENIRKISRIIRQILSYSLYETSTRRLILWRNKKQKDKFLFDTLQSRKKKELNTLAGGPEKRYC